MLIKFNHILNFSRYIMSRDRRNLNKDDRRRVVNHEMREAQENNEVAEENLRKSEMFRY